MHRRSLLLSTAAATAVTAAGTGAAFAAHPVHRTHVPAARPVMSHPFAAWGDHRDYFRAPGAAFRTGRTVRVDAGRSVTTAGFSGVNMPSLRFVDARQGAAGSRLVVSLLIGRGGHIRSVRLATVRGASADRLSPSVRVPVRLQRQLDRAHATVRVRFTSVGRAAWTLRDVYIDPFLRCGSNCV